MASSGRLPPPIGKMIDMGEENIIYEVKTCPVNMCYGYDGCHRRQFSCVSEKVFAHEKEPTRYNLLWKCHATTAEVIEYDED